MPNTALLVIDIQRAAFDGVRCPPMDSPGQLLRSARTLIDAARAGGHPIIFIQHCDKHDLAVRPIYHRNESRIEAHIFVAFLAYCLQVTLKAKLRTLAGDITPHEVLTTLKAMQLVDVRVPTTDGRELLLTRYTQPEPAQRMLLDGLRMKLPAQAPPRITSSQVRSTPKRAVTV